MQRYQQYQNSPFFIGPKDTDKACLLIHGFVGTPAELRGLGEALAEQGIRAHGIVLPGHEGNPEGLVNIGWKQWLAFAEQGLAELASYPHVFLAGLSMLALAAVHVGIFMKFYGGSQSLTAAAFCLLLGALIYERFGRGLGVATRKV